MNLKRTIGVIAAAAILVVPVAGCSGNMISSVSAIGAQGTGADSYELTAVIPSAAGLVRNAPVMMRDSTVGSIRDIRIKSWSAEVVMRLDGTTKVPVGSHAMVGMTSVLGSSHIAIVPPEKTDAGYKGPYIGDGGSLAATKCPEQENIAAPVGKKNPDINSAQQVDPCMYPTTEQVLSSLSVVLNGGGLSQLGDVVHELNGVFGGNENTLKQLIPRLNVLVADLNSQTDNIITAMEGLDRLSAEINRQTPTVQRALESGPEILQLLVDQRQNLTTALKNVGELSSTANDILDANSGDIKTIVPNMEELLKQLSMTGPALSNSLRILLTFPFVEDLIPTIVKGDYVNSDLVLDLTFSRLNKTMVASLGINGPEGVVGKPAGQSKGGGDPFKDPLKKGTQRKQTNPGNPTLQDVLPKLGGN